MSKVSPQKSVVAAVLFVVVLVCMANYYLDLGFFGRAANQLYALCVLLAVISLFGWLLPLRELEQRRKRGKSR